MERVTRLERATNSLEGCDSSQLSYTRKVCVTYYIYFIVRFKKNGG